jgi:hypothetical protein
MVPKNMGPVRKSVLVLLCKSNILLALEIGFWEFFATDLYSMHDMTLSYSPVSKAPKYLELPFSPVKKIVLF